MFYLIGLGLNVDSLSKEAEIILKKCKKVYLESYTIDFPYSLKELEKEIGECKVLDRKKVESEEIVLEARDKDVALLVYGSPLIATTHISLILRAEKEKIPCKIIHNASVFDAISETGLQNYKFGKIASLPSWKDKGKSLSFIRIIKDNQSIWAHTLILVDMNLQVKEALEELEEAMKEEKMKVDKIVVCSRLGTEHSKIVYGEIEELEKKKLELPICFIIPSKLHFLEEEALKRFEV
jgi:diphthine synthase